MHRLLDVYSRICAGSFRQTLQEVSYFGCSLRWYQANLYWRLQGRWGLKLYIPCDTCFPYQVSYYPLPCSYIACNSWFYTIFNIILIVIGLLLIQTFMWWQWNFDCWMHQTYNCNSDKENVVALAIWLTSITKSDSCCQNKTKLLPYIILLVDVTNSN